MANMPGERKATGTDDEVFSKKYLYREAIYPPFSYLCPSE